MTIRFATEADIPAMHTIRVAVKENQLSDPSRISREHYLDFITRRGKGWVCCLNDHLAGFAIVDLSGHNIWALFVDPGFEHRGVGRALHDAMVDWYFAHTSHPLWLGTAPHTRAAGFYRQAGWHEVDGLFHGEIRFEMDWTDWNRLAANKKGQYPSKNSSPS